MLEPWYGTDIKHGYNVQLAEDEPWIVDEWTIIKQKHLLWHTTRPWMKQICWVSRSAPIATLIAVAVVTSISYQAAWNGNMFWVIVFESKNLFYIIVIIIIFFSFSFSFFNKIFLLKSTVEKWTKILSLEYVKLFKWCKRLVYIKPWGLLNLKCIFLYLNDSVNVCFSFDMFFLWVYKSAFGCTLLIVWLLKV